MVPRGRWFILVLSPCLISAASMQTTKSEDITAVIADKKNGLLWQASPKHQLDFNAAGAYCSSLNLGGKRGWRLPTLKELRDGFKVLPSGDGIADGKTFMHWTSTATKSCCAMLVLRNTTTSFGPLVREKDWKPGKAIILGARCVRDEKQ